MSMTTVEKQQQPSEAQEELTTDAPPPTPVPQDQRQKGKRETSGNIMAVINRPWLLLLVPLLVGGIWLVNNLWIITDNLDKPTALLAGPALVSSILAGWLVITFFRTIAQWCVLGWRAFVEWRKQPGSFFWIVISIFLVVSVSEAGSYFNGLLGTNDFYGTLGYAAAFVIDLVAIDCMRARLGAARMRDQMGKRLYLLGVIACAGFSAYANTYTALEHFTAPKNTLLPEFMLRSAPWTGMIFPLLIIFLSFTADYTADQLSSKLDPEAYKQAENQRLKLLEYQRDALRTREGIERDIDTITAKQTHKKEQRTFFLINWLFPRNPPYKMHEIIAAVAEEMKKIYEPQFQTLTEQNLKLHNEIQTFTGEAKQAYGTLNTSLSQQVTGIQEQLVQQIVTIQDQRETDFHLVGKSIEQLQRTALTKDAFEESIKRTVKALEELEQTAVTRDAFDERFTHVEEQLKQAKEDEAIQLQIRLNTLAQSVEESSVQHAVKAIQNGAHLEVISGRNHEQVSGSFSYKNDAEEPVEYAQKREKITGIEGEESTPIIELNEQERQVLMRYPIVMGWLTRGLPSVTLEEIIAATGHTPQLLKRRVNDNTFKRTKRKGKYRTNSVIAWLITAPLPKNLAQQIEDEHHTENQTQIPDAIPSYNLDITEKGYQQIEENLAVNQGLNQGEEFEEIPSAHEDEQTQHSDQEPETIPAEEEEQTSHEENHQEDVRSEPEVSYEEQELTHTTENENIERGQVQPVPSPQSEIVTVEIDTQMADVLQNVSNSQEEIKLIELQEYSLDRTADTTEEQLKVVPSPRSQVEDHNQVVEETHGREEQHTESLPAVSGKQGDKLIIALAALRENPSITDAELAEKLAMKRSASARFWRLKAESILTDAVPQAV